VSGWLLVGGVALGAYAALVLALVPLGRRGEARAIAGFVPDCAVLVKRLMGDARVPRRHKLALALLACYLLMPIDLVPDFIPVAGQLDDAILVAVVLRRVLRGNGELVRAHWPGPAPSLAVVLRMAAA
jgi:uncharacterized membrane protein YkvA (DUF1232 family)